MLFFACIVVCNGPNIASYDVYEAYWLMDFPLINSRSVLTIFTFLKQHAQINHS